MLALRKKSSKKKASGGDLSEREQQLRDEIAALEDFVAHGAEREREAAIERGCTLPPPSEIQDRAREKEFMDRLSRGQIDNEKRAQATNGLLLILLTLAICAIGVWIYSVAVG